MDSLISF